MTARTNRIRPLFAAVALLISAWPAVAASGSAFRKALNATTGAQVSARMPDVGQSMHMIVVLFPTATEDVSDLQIRIEASNDPTADSPLWFPISADVTTARYLTSAGAAYAIERANGYYPGVRVRAIASSATLPLTVWYTAGNQPVGHVVWDGSRYLPQAPAGRPERITWGLCPNSDCVVASNITVPFIVTRAMAFSKCYLAAKTAPAGSSLVFNIRKNGTSVFSGSFPSLTSGQTYATYPTAAAPTATFAVTNVVEGDLLTIDITAVGSSTAGKDVNVTCLLN